ncbi:MAG TPA: polysaccharide pyruvyl transferase family protein [Aestuariivirga sp.]
MLPSKSGSLSQSSQLRVFLVAPADPGNLGDEAMMFGALYLFGKNQITIVNDSEKSPWQTRLMASPHAAKIRAELTETLLAKNSTLGQCDLVFIVGADLIDGTCGDVPSLNRLTFAEQAIKRGSKVIITCSFRHDVIPPILHQLRELRGAEFWLRDELSLDNFEKRVGLPARRVPDLSFYYDPEISPAGGAQLPSPNKARAPLIALNLSEQSFRSFFDVHTDANRKDYADHVVEQVSIHMPKAHYLLLSNDNRFWPNHPSDDAYVEFLRDALCVRLGPKTVIHTNNHHDYGENIRALAQADLLVTGRMHLALAAIRSNCKPLVLMGRTKGYTSYDKMRGMLLDTLNDHSGIVQEIGQLAPAVAAALRSKKAYQSKSAKAFEARQLRLKTFEDQVTSELQLLASNRTQPSVFARLSEHFF